MIDDPTLSDEPKSKSQRKREFNEFNNLAKRLIELPEKTFAQVPMSEQLREHAVLARSLKKGALKRQLRFMTKLIADEGGDEIQQSLDAVQHAHDLNTRAFRELEAWRDQLIAGDQDLLTDLISRFDQADAQHLRQLMRNANRESDQNKPPRAARLLFKYLSNLRDN